MKNTFLFKNSRVQNILILKYLHLPWYVTQIFMVLYTSTQIRLGIMWLTITTTTVDQFNLNTGKIDECIILDILATWKIYDFWSARKIYFLACFLILGHSGKTTFQSTPLLTSHKHIIRLYVMSNSILSRVPLWSSGSVLATDHYHHVQISAWVYLNGVSSLTSLRFDFGGHSTHLAY